MNVAQTPRRTNRTTQSVTTARKLMVIRLAGQAYGIPLAEVQEVVPLPLLARPPGLPSILAGVFNLAGTSVGVVRLGRLFGDAEHPPQLYTPLIVLRQGDPSLALMVDETAGIESIVDDDILAVSENSSFNDCAEGVALIRGEQVLVLSTERILTKTERQRLAQSVALHNARLADMEGGRV